MFIKWNTIFYAYMTNLCDVGGVGGGGREGEGEGEREGGREGILHVRLINTYQFPSIL